MIDAGLSYRQVLRRLEFAGAAPEEIGAIVITHAHGDHTRGASIFSRKHGIPVYTTKAAKREWGDVELAEWRPIRLERTDDICGWRFEALAVPHDASETVAFRIGTGDGTIGFATDVGVMTTELVGWLRQCRVLVVESNHAADLLDVSPYNRSTRERIGGGRGHLSNESLATFIRTDLGASVRCIVLAHLSRVNNVPEIAEMSCRDALSASGRDDVEVIVTWQNKVAATVDLGALHGTGSPTHAGFATSRAPAAQPRLPFA